MKKIVADVVIFGGGVAGLWLLNRLRKAGRSVLLFDSGALGGGQTHKAQGIIHGGMKYALQGIITNEVRAMADMPLYWKNCLSGQGELDLSAVPILSAKQYLWSPNKITSKITGFLAGRTLSSQVASVNNEEFPAIFKHAKFKGEIFSLDEMVIDVPALVHELVKHHHDAIFKIEPLIEEGLKLDEDGRLISATVHLSGDSLEITAQQFVFTAGSGNGVIINKIKNKEVAMQLRPLHMVLVKLPFDYPVYAHCLGLGSRPRLTITTHYTEEGHTIWYLGGALAEDGVGRGSQTQIQAARRELITLFPWLDFNKAEFATFGIDRAEPLQKNGLKPESTVIKVVKNMCFAWPTKLALAPKLAEDILKQLGKSNLSESLLDVRGLDAWPRPPIAKPIWEELFCKNVS